MSLWRCVYPLAASLPPSRREISVIDIFERSTYGVVNIFDITIQVDHYYLGDVEDTCDTPVT